MLRLLLIFGFFMYSASALADDAPIRVWLASERNGDTLIVIPHAAATAWQPLRYELVSTKNGTAGRSTTSQSGTVKRLNAEGVPLATLKLSLHDGERVNVAVKLYEGARLAAQAKAHYPE